MYITKKTERDAIVFQIKGIFDSTDLSQFQKAISDAKVLKPCHIILDLRDVSILDHSAAKAILVTYSELKKISIQFTLIRPKGYINEMLSSKRIKSRIPIADTVDEVLASS